MYQIILCYRRRRSVSRAAFRTYWRRDRMPLLRGLQGKLAFSDYALLRRASRLNPLYVGIRLSRSWPFAALSAASRGLSIPPPFSMRSGDDERWDVVETLTYESPDTIVEALSRPEGREALSRLRNDAESLVRNGAAIVGERHAVRSDASLGRRRTVTMLFLRPRPPKSGGEMLQYWGGSHRALVESLTSALGHRLYDQLHAVRDPATAGALDAFGGRQLDPFDGVARLGYTSQWALIRRLIDPRLHIANFRLVRDEVGFIDLGGSALVFGEEETL
jgi:hypothetical protein